MSATFDTLRLVRSLRDKAQFSTEQAEGMADALAEAMQGDLATKSDLREVELRLEARIEATKADLIKWLVGMIGFQTIVLLGAALALARAVAK